MNWRAIARVPRSFLIANVVLVGLGVFFVVSLTHELARSTRVPAPRALSPRGAAAPASPPTAAAGDRLESYNVIAAKTLFNPARSESAAVPAAAPVGPPPVKPLLHGVVLDGAASLAYLEDPVTRRVLVYHIGDAVGGGKLVQIGEDRVSIVRPDAKVDVLLKDPSKPQPVAAAAQTQQQPGQPARALRGGGFVNPPTAQPPGSAQFPPRGNPPPAAPEAAPPRPEQAEE